MVSKDARINVTFEVEEIKEPTATTRASGSSMGGTPGSRGGGPPGARNANVRESSPKETEGSFQEKIKKKAKKIAKEFARSPFETAAAFTGKILPAVPFIGGGLETARTLLTEFGPSAQEVVNQIAGRTPFPISGALKGLAITGTPAVKAAQKTTQALEGTMNAIFEARDIASAMALAGSGSQFGNIGQAIWQVNQAEVARKLAIKEARNRMAVAGGFRTLLGPAPTAGASRAKNKITRQIIKQIQKGGR